jgi:exopolysaccharide biosynthesis polyprenyl glycosylphosphotransferase
MRRPLATARLGQSSNGKSSNGHARAADDAPSRVRVVEREALALERRAAPDRRIEAGGRRLWRQAYRSLLHSLLLLAVLPSAAIVAPGAINPPAFRWVLCYGVALLVLDSLSKLSRRQIRLDVLNETRDLLLATTLAALATLSLRVVLTDDPTVAAQTLNIWAISTALLIPARLALSGLELRARRAGVMSEPTLIVGAGRVGRLAARRLLEQPELGLRPLGFLDKSPLELNGSAAGLPVLGASWDLEDVVEQYQVTHVIFTFSTAPHEVFLDMLDRCRELGVSVSLIPRLFEKMTARVSVDHVGGLPLISLHPSDPKGWQFRLKYGIEQALSAGLVIFTSPLLAACAVGVWLSAGRPILYRQRRVGLDGREFDILKFRSMKEAPDEGVPDLPPDTAPGGVETFERRTRFGRFLRRTSLDELPQLFNVIRGEMSLVGPRPERPQFAQIFQRDVYRYDDRLRVKSGITGWAQVHGLRGQTSLSDRVEWDNYYIENWSFWLDVKIMLLTLRAVFSSAED